MAAADRHSKRWLLYGATGYTGRLIAKRAQRKGLNPILGGRRASALSELARDLNLRYRVLDLSEPDAVRAQLDDIDAVLNCAGPFTATAPAMVDACLRAGTHYLDITGEIPVFEHCHNQDARARERGVALVPGVGFDVVPTDCLAAKLKAALPGATSLVLAFEAEGGPSPGTAKTAVQGLGDGGLVRRGGRLRRVPLAYKTREVTFKKRRRLVVTIPWGDVYTAYVTTGIPDIEVYMSAPPRAVKRLQRLRYIRYLLKLPPVRAWLQRRAGARTRGPDEGTRSTTHCYIYGEVGDGQGGSARGHMVTPNGYTMTVNAALGVVERVLGEGVPGGYYTPALLMGADFAASLPDVEMVVA